MKIVIFSDTHGKHRDIVLPEADLMICAGDMTIYGSRTELLKFAEWFGEQPGEIKLATPGNHDFCFQDRRRVQAENILGNHEIHTVIDGTATVYGLNIYLSPWTPTFGDWAFMQDDDLLGYRWKMIPDDTDILVTHGPPFGILDETVAGPHAGSKTLRHRVLGSEIALHAFGHIHEGHGSIVLAKQSFHNVSICDFFYDPTNEPLYIGET